MTNKFKKAFITIPVTIVFALATIGGTYFANLITTNNKIAEVKAEVKADISKDRERISSVEKGMEMMLENQKIMMGDIKSLIGK